MKIFKYLLLLLAFISSSTLLAQEYGKWGITAYGAAAIPTGDFYNTGYGGAAGIVYDFKYNTRFALTIGYTKWEVDEAKVNKDYQEDGGIGTLNIEAPVRIIPILIQARWYATREKINLYALIEFGFYFTKSEVSGTVTDNDSTLAQFSGKQSNTNTGVNLGLGVTFEIADNIEIDLAGRYHIVSTNNVLETEQFWSFAAGINVIVF
jgi:opacity protein-like surface antigen